MRAPVWRNALLAGLLAAGLLAAPAAPAQAQGNGVGFGATTPGVADYASQATSADEGPSDAESGVGYIESALVRSQFRFRIEADYGDHRPSRAEFLYVKNGLPFTREPTPETNIDAQELSAYLELAIQGRFSFFVEAPYLFVNPTVNSNENGFGDINAGFKWAFISSTELTTTFMLRATIPSYHGEWLSTYHYSLEPGLLVNFHPMQYVTFEGELRYWTALGGTDFAGDLIRYGVGVSIGEHDPDGFWVTPVFEFVGWSLLSGQELVVFPAGNVGPKGSAGETILNAKAGVRLGWASLGDMYVGYGRALTGDAWYKDVWRVEFRLFF
jgi:hypothetical protein